MNIPTLAILFLGTTRHGLTPPVARKIHMVSKIADHSEQAGEPKWDLLKPGKQMSQIQLSQPPAASIRRLMHAFGR